MKVTGADTKEGTHWVLSRESSMWMSKSFGVVVGPNGKGDSNPVAKDSKGQVVVYNGNRRSKV